MRNTVSRPGRVLLAAAAVLALGLAGAQAKPGGSMGSRGSKTFSAPPATSTAPTSAAPIQRSVTQPGGPASMAQAPAAAAAQQKRGLFGGFGGGLMAGLLGAGIFGMLMGGGFFSGLGSLAGLLGFVLQAALIGGLVFLAIRFFRSRQAPAPATANGIPAERLQRMGLDPASAPAPAPSAGAMGAAAGGAGALGLSGLGRPQAAPQPAEPSDTVGIGERDFATFERLLGEIYGAWDAEDEGSLRRFTTPEMAAYFGQDLSDNAAKGLHDRVKDVKLLQGDLAEAWSEPDADYATVAMRFSYVNALFERASGRIVSGDPEKAQESTEIWTFRRERGRNWVLSAIQQVEQAGLQPAA